MAGLERRLAALERRALDPPDARDVWLEAVKRTTDEDLAVLAGWAERWLAAGGVGVRLATPEERAAWERFEGLRRDVRRDRRLSPERGLPAPETPEGTPEAHPPVPP